MALCMLARRSSGNCMSWVTKVKCRPLQICCQFVSRIFKFHFWAHLCTLHGGLIFITVHLSIRTWPKIGDKTDPGDIVWDCGIGESRTMSAGETVVSMHSATIYQFLDTKQNNYFEWLNPHTLLRGSVRTPERLKRLAFRNKTWSGKDFLQPK